jgi:exosome complex exonuclease DIS3/RRP44
LGVMVAGLACRHGFKTDYQPTGPQPNRNRINPPQVKANGLIVFVPRYGIEGSVYLTPKEGEGGGGGGGAAGEQQQQFVLDEERQVVSSADGRLRFTIFDKCAVRIVVEEGAGHRRQLVLSLVPREQLPATEIMG